MPDFSVVTIVSKPDVYDTCLLKSLTSVRFGHDIEIIPIINTNGLYSASNALNIGLDSSRSDNVVFVHQDVSFLHGWFDILKSNIDSITDEWGVIGTAGVSLNYSRNDISRWGGTIKDNKIIVGSVWDSCDNLDDTPYWNGIKELTKVHCVDECAFVLNKKTGLRFDTLFNGYHFYSADISMQSRSAAFNVYCAGLPIIHHGTHSTSMSSHSNGYWSGLRLLHSKWRSQFPEVLGTHFHWNINRIKTSYGQTIEEPELASYINTSLDSSDGLQVSIRSVNLKNVKLKSDRSLGIID